MSLLLAETLDGAFDVRSSREVLSRRPPIVITDCKSLYDHLTSPSSPTNVEDRRTSIDITIIKESVRSCSAHVRWVPTNRMLADGLTKDVVDPIDLLRSCIRSSSYQISPETEVLERQSAEKQLRLERQSGSSSVNESQNWFSCNRGFCPISSVHHGVKFSTCFCLWKNGFSTAVAITRA